MKKSQPDLDLFTSAIAEAAEPHLKRFSNGEITRDQTLLEVIQDVRIWLKLIMNTIAINYGLHPHSQRIG
ncbi:MAG: hypothetical protein WC806_05215 [Candidatus Gracilibacteria bacterium]